MPSNTSRPSTTKKPGPRYPQFAKTTGLSDYLSQKKRRTTRDTKWQWLTLAALVLSLPAILFSIQSKVFDFVKGSQGESATAVIVPYDSEMTEYQDYRVLLHLPASIESNTTQSNIFVLFDTAHLKLDKITPLAENLTINTIENANQNGEVSLSLPTSQQSGLVSILELRFKPKTGLPAYTKLTISPNSFIRLTNNQTRLIKGNSASVKIVSNL